MGFNEQIQLRESETVSFSFGDGVTHDGTVTESSISLIVDFESTWSIVPVLGSLVGQGLYTVEVSNGAGWFEYATEFTDVVTEDSVTHDSMEYNQLRISYRQSSVSSGTVEFQLTKKDR